MVGKVLGTLEAKFPDNAHRVTLIFIAPSGSLADTLICLVNAASLQWISVEIHISSKPIRTKPALRPPEDILKSAMASHQQ